MTRPANSEPGSEKPIARRDPTAVVSQRSLEDLPQDQFDELASHLRAKDLATMLPDDVTGIGSRRRP